MRSMNLNNSMMKATTFKFLCIFVWCIAMFGWMYGTLLIAFWLLDYSLPWFLGVLFTSGWLARDFDKLLKWLRYKAYRRIRPGYVSKELLAWLFWKFVIVKYRRSSQVTICWKDTELIYFNKGEYYNWGFYSPMITFGVLEKVFNVGKLTFHFNFKIAIGVGKRSDGRYICLNLPFIDLIYYYG